MVVRIVIAGETQDEVFAEICLIADYLAQNLPTFCWERIENPVLEWEAFLLRMNNKNKWHHVGSPLIWKEMLMAGSKPLYIGGAPEFLEYCHSYYNTDVFLSPQKVEELTVNLKKFKNKLMIDKKEMQQYEDKREMPVEPEQTDFVITITGAGNPLTLHLISGLLEMSIGKKSISKIYLFDDDCTHDFMESVERECFYVNTNYSGKVVKYVERIGTALTNTDLLIVFDHAPFDVQQPLGEWLAANRSVMTELSSMINASGTRKMLVLFPNVGPACFNATVLSQMVNLNKENIVVATSDLGLDISTVAAEIAEIPLRNMFCPPVWGFVGVNHLVDIRTTVHRYDSFVPYKRFAKVRNSSLMIGYLTPEFRTMEYLMYFDETLWSKVAEQKAKYSKFQKQVGLNKMLAVLNLVREWLFERNPEHIVSVGVKCNGSFGLTFNGTFSQPARFKNGKWEPAADYLLPKDPQMSLKYLQEMAEYCMNMKSGELPEIVPYFPCTCKTKYFKKPVWV